jgi:hypothetical protein
MGSDPIMLSPGIVSLCGREDGAFEGASWHAGKLTREIREWQQVPET